MNYNPNQPQRPICPALLQNNGRPLSFWKALLKDVLVTFFGVAFFCGFLLFIFIILGAAIYQAVESSDTSEYSMNEIAVSGSDDAQYKVVTLPIDGTIETDEYGFIVNAVKTIREDPKVRALVLRINSPGGTISGSDYYYQILKKLKEDLNIPIIVSMGDLTASGGYYISMAADKIYAERSTMTGSIGVIVNMYNAAGLCEKLGVGSNPIVSGPMKGMGNMTKEMSEEETAIWQALVDESYEQFLDVVVEGRPWFRGQEDVAVIEPKQRKDSSDIVDVIVEVTDQSEEDDEQETVAREDDDSETVDSDLLAQRRGELRVIADGRIYTARQALEMHLIDEIGFLDDAIDAAMEAAGISKKNTQVVRYAEETTILQSLGLGVKSNNDTLGKALKEASAPKAYYLCPRALPL